MLLLLLLAAAAAAADGDAALVKLLLQALLRMMRLEVMLLLWVEGEVMAVAEHRYLDHGGAVETRPAVEASGCEGLDGGARNPLLAAHLGGAGPFIGGLRLRLHHRWRLAGVGSGSVLWGRWCDDLVWMEGLEEGEEGGWIRHTVATVWLNWPPCAV